MAAMKQQHLIDQQKLRDIISGRDEEIRSLRRQLEAQRQDFEKAENDWFERYEQMTNSAREELQTTKANLSARCDELQNQLTHQLQLAAMHERQLEACGVNPISLEKFTEKTAQQEDEEKQFASELQQLSSYLSTAMVFLHSSVSELASVQPELDGDFASFYANSTMFSSSSPASAASSSAPSTTLEVGA